MGSRYTELQEYSKCVLYSYVKTVRNKLSSDKTYLDQASAFVLDQLIDDLTLEVVAEYHRAITKGYVDHIYPNKLDEKYDSESLSRESQSCEQAEKKIEDIKCPNCSHPINASRFAPHLEKCMGIGRSSTRIASRRIASNSKESNYAAVSDDEDDEYWNSGSKRSNKIAKKIEQKKKKDLTKKPNRLLKDFKLGKGENRSKDEGAEWLASPKMQLSPVSASRIRKGATHDKDTETEDTSATPSPADSNSTSSGSISRRDKVKPKRRVTKNCRYSEDPDTVVCMVKRILF